MNKPPSPDFLRTRLRIEPATGHLFWKVKIGDDHETIRWNKRFAGKRAGTKAAYGYRVISFGDFQYKEHQVVWAISFGEWPDFPIDHINGQRADNRAANLRRANPKVQARNRKRPADNTSGYIGVAPTPHSTWISYISTDRGRKHLGSFKCVTAAAVARVSAQSRDATYHKNHGRDK